MNLTQSINFYQKYLLLVDEIKDISDLYEFYENYFDELKSFSKVRVWQTSEWKEKRKEIINKNPFCVKCGSSENLVLQHAIPYPGRFLYFKQFYGKLKLISSLVFKSLRKKYGFPSEIEVLELYKEYLRAYFERIVIYFKLENVQVYCIKCAFKEDRFYVIAPKVYFGIFNCKVDNFLSNFYEKKQNRTTREERP